GAIITIIKTKKYEITLFYLLPLFSVVYIATINICAIAVKPAGLVTIENSELFWLSQHKAMQYQFFPNLSKGWKISIEQSQKTEKIAETINMKLEKQICDLFNNPEVHTEMEELIKEQRWFFGIVMLFTGFFLSILLG